MEFFKIRKDIPFMRHALVLNAVSFITFILAVFFLFSRGLHLSVEFTGGTLMEVSFSQAVALDPMRERIAALGINDVQVQNFGSSRDVLIRMPAAKGSNAAELSTKVMGGLKEMDPSASCGAPSLSGLKWATSWPLMASKPWPAWSLAS